jgi:electron transfer flavoprotein alpha subunit
MKTPIEILVYSEDRALQKELLGKARQVADQVNGKVALFLLGESTPVDTNVFAQAGADKIYLPVGADLQKYHTDTYTGALSSGIKQIEPAVVLIGATKRGFEIAPRVAERLSAGYASWALDFEIDSIQGQVTAKCMIYSGIGTAIYHFNLDTILLTVAPGVFTVDSNMDRTAQVVELVLDYPAPIATILEYKNKADAGTRVEEAKYIIDLGQGVKQKEDLAMFEELADKLGGQVTCTRPLSSDKDWFPEWLGLSGKKIHPNLCLTLGISGAIQHVIGIRDSKVIAAINNDENAGIFTQADYGVVADLYEFFPVFMERMKAREIKPV